MLTVALAMPERPVLHVFASHRRYGGGWRNHGRAQEEALFRATELPDLTPPKGAYPIDGEEGRCGFLLAGICLDYAFVPAPVGSATWGLRARAEALAKLAEGRILVTGAWGCGAFGNDPRQVAAEMARALRPQARGVRLVFAEDSLLAVFESAFCQVEARR